MSVLDIEDLSKSFVGTKALSSFSLSLSAGEIHALVGANGSGKSTLIKVLSGFHVPDSGRVHVDGHALTFGAAESAYKLGCRFVHQDLALIDTVSVVDNLHLSTQFPTRMLTIRPRNLRDSAAALLDQIGLSHIDPRQPVGQLSAAERTGVAVARALQPDEQNPPKVLVLDEPTATLPIEEIDHLLAILTTAADRGLAVLYVTHHLDEVHRIGHSVTILRDGQSVARAPTADISRDTLVSLLGGAENAESEPEVLQPARRAHDASLMVDDLWEGPIRGISLTATGGEIIGVAGLTGSGRERLLGAIFGAYTRSRGTVTVGGTPIPAGRPDAAIAAGAAYLPADRKSSGGIMSLSADDNLVIGDLRPFWSRLFLRKSAVARESRVWFERLDVRPRSGGRQQLQTFSGGNQQKILLAKWLRLNPQVLLLDEPTQGVDVRAKADIHHHILEAARNRALVLVSSTDIDELLLLCSRVVVVRQGHIRDELSGARLTESEVTRSFMSEITTLAAGDGTAS
jgi:ribose transport system ATP-binding protein